MATRNYKEEHAVDVAGMHSIPTIGVVQAYYSLAYNLYLLKHNAEVQNFLLKRLRNAEQFYPAYYETYVAAWFILAGFELALEDEQDLNVTHCEFVANKDEKIFSVEVKARSEGKSHFDIGRQLHKALEKTANHPRIIFIDLNMGVLDNEEFLRETNKSISCRENKLKVLGEPAPPAYVFVTNQPDHINLTATRMQRSCFAYGFKISGFGYNAKHLSLIDEYKARKKHAELNSIIDAFFAYSIPNTFDGEIPEFAFGESERRFVIGERYEVSKGVFGVLDAGIVPEQSSLAQLFFKLDGGEMITSSVSLTEAEMRAYRQHKETFFGRIQKQPKNMSDPVEMLGFFYDFIKSMPREKVLEKLVGAHNFTELSKLGDEDLRLVYAELQARGVFSRKQ